MEPLHAEEIVDHLKALDGWELVHGERIRRELHFDSFVQAFGVMAQVAVWAEKLNHHPEWSNVYSRLTIELTTHDVGGLTARDIELAGRIDEIVAPLLAG